MAAGALGTPRNAITSAAPRSSISIAAPSGVARSTVDSGATTTNGTPAWRAASASENEPTLFAVSPLAVIRSAPMSTTSAMPRASTEAAAPSTRSRNGAPICSSSQAVSRAALEQGPRLERQRLLEGAAGMELADDAERRAALDRREGAGVADRHRPDRRSRHEVPDEVRAAGGHGGARGDVLVADGDRLLEDGLRARLEPRERPVHAPGEVDGGRPGGAQGAGIGPDPVGIGGLATPPGEERDAHRARHAERRRAADREPRDRIDERVEGRDPEHDELVGEAGLVDELDPAVDPVDGARHRPIFAGADGTLGPTQRRPTRRSRCPTSSPRRCRCSAPPSTGGRRSPASTRAARAPAGARRVVGDPGAPARRGHRARDLQRAGARDPRRARRSAASTPTRRATSTGSRTPPPSSWTSSGRCGRRASRRSRRSCRADLERTGTHSELGRGDDGRAAQRMGRARHDAHRPGGAGADPGVHPRQRPVARATSRTTTWSDAVRVLTIDRPRQLPFWAVTTVTGTDTARRSRAGTS